MKRVITVFVLILVLFAVLTMTYLRKDSRDEAESRDKEAVAIQNISM